jgi:hypothetical protein
VNVTIFQLFGLVLSSSVLAALISLAGQHLLAQLQFKRDYFRELIAKRLSAYQQLDEIIGILRGVTYDDSGRIAHIVFMNQAVWDRTMFLIAGATGLGLYISQAAHDCVSELNFVLLKLPHNAPEREAFDIANANREVMSDIRQRLEQIVASDLLTLYKIRAFLRQKHKSATKPDMHLQMLPGHGAFSFRRSPNEGK